MQNHAMSIAVLTGLVVVAAFAPAAATEGSEIALQATPPQYHGPYYPSALPRDTDNDLVLINDTETPAAGEIVHLSGRILDLDGNPVANALVELWQTDSAGVYLHHDSPNRSDYDRNFQGFGRVLTGPSGEYYFRTVRPATHLEKRMRRAPHMHLGVFVQDKSSVFTQLYFEGEMLNERDPILNSVHDPEQKALLVVPVAREMPGPGESTVTFDIVMRFRNDG